MNLEWDSFVPPPAVWDECLRVLKPGGHLACFAGSRTLDLMTLSVRMAGFEIRDTIAAWVYSCLTSDVEILTEHGWKPGIDVQVGERVAQWDPATGGVTLAAVEDTFRGPWDGPMRVLRNADTDQVLTPNHRVYHRPAQRRVIDGHRARWYDDEWQVAEAGQLSTWNPTQLPVAGEHDGTGIGGDDYAALLGWVWTEGGFDHSGTGVRIYQSSVNAEKVDEIAALMDRLGPHKRYDYRHTYQRRNGQPHEYVHTTWFFTGALAERVRADLPGKRPTYDLLWRMTASEKRAMRDAALLGDGSVGPYGSWQFYQQYEDDLIWFSTLLALVGQAGKVGMRSNRPGGAVYVRDRAQTELQARHLRDSAEHYTGEVWCVSVPTGAFVARRNGRVFITGNSGFAKSLDVSKAIDQLNGRSMEQRYALAQHIRAQREAVGVSRKQVADRFPQHREVTANWERTDLNGNRVPSLADWNVLAPWLRLSDEWMPLVERVEAEREVIARGANWGRTRREQGKTVLGDYAGEWDVTAAATADASDWDGWGTALAPAFEPIILARKPLSGTVAATVLEHGTGGLNIAATRTGAGATVPGGGGWAAHKVEKTDGWDRPYVNGVEKTEGHSSGRWPKNVVLAHHPSCSDECHPDCHVRALDEQTGTLRNGGANTASADGNGGMFFAGRSATSFAGDSGGGSRFFPTFRYEAKAPTSERPQVNGTAHPTVKPLSLVRWLCRLLVPPGGTVLDCFAGSGTTGQAARAEGFTAVLVEQYPLPSKPVHPVDNPDYIALIKARLDARERTPGKATGEVSGGEPLDLLDLLNEEAS